MEPVQYLRALRQWWYVIVLLTVVGFGAAIATTSTPTPSYDATHILVVESSDADSVDLARAAFLATNGDVPDRVAAVLSGDADALARSVFVESDEALEGLRITASSSDAERAELVADTFATELVTFLDERSATNYTAELQAATVARDAAFGALTAAGANATAAQRNQYEDAVDRLAILVSDGAPTAGLATIGNTQVERTSSATTSRTMRAAVGGLVGLFLGLTVALVLARFDTRIRSRQRAEEAFRAPVIAEIPVVSRKIRKSHQIVTQSDPESIAAESYRGLRTALLVASGAQRVPATRAGRQLQRRPVEERRGRVVMVASPGMGEGKTTTSANLAVAFAESGREVIVVGCDLRRPELQSYFGLTDRPGMSDALKPGSNASLESVIRDTEIPRVRVITSGAPLEHPGELLAQGLPQIYALADIADIVIIDTAPLLATDDASVLLPLVDDVVVVCRAGRTPTEAGALASELLERLNARVVGVALIGAQQLPSARSYYRSDYRSRTRPPAEPLAFPKDESADSASPEPGKDLAEPKSSESSLGGA